MLNIKTKKIYKLIFEDVQNTKKTYSEKNEDEVGNRLLLEQAYLMTKTDRKRMVTECIVYGLGFESFSEYNKKTTYLIDIKKMRRYQDLEYTLLLNVFNKIKTTLLENFYFRNPDKITFEWFFLDEVNDRLYPLKYRFKRTDKSRKDLLNSVIAYTNQHKNKNETLNGDFIEENGTFNYKKLEIFVNKFVFVSNVSNQKSNFKDKNKFEIVYKRFKFKHPFSRYGFLKKITHSIMATEYKDAFLMLSKKEREHLLSLINELEMWDLSSIFSEFNKDLYNSDFNHFATIFNSCFLEENEYKITTENINEFGNILIDKYS